MTNREKAVGVIRRQTLVSDVHTARDIVRRLDQAGLITPDLPQAGLITPDLPTPRMLTPEANPEWARNQCDEWEWLPDVRFDGTTTPFYLTVKDGETDGGFALSQEEWLNMNPVQLREIAAILLATADHIEENDNTAQ